MGVKYLIIMLLMSLIPVPVILLKTLFKFLQRHMEYHMKPQALESKRIQVLLKSVQAQLSRGLEQAPHTDPPPDLKVQVVVVCMQ
jgi:hypothetical protein